MGFWRYVLIAVQLLVLNVGLVHGTEDDLYDFLWLDPDKKVYVLQNKVYEKKKRFMFDVGYIRGLSSDFQDTSGFQLKAGYYFTEEWEFELVWNQYNNSNNDTYNNLGLINGVVPFVRKIEDSKALVANWSPFYGKINTFNKIVYFDWSFGAGLAFVNTESNARTAADSTIDEYDKESNTGLLLKSDLKFHVTENIHINLEYQNVYIKERGPGPNAPQSTNTITDIVLSVGFSF